MQRFMLFAGSSYYPIGGMYDLVGTFDSEDDARDHLKVAAQDHGSVDWWHIVRLDPTDATMVAKGSISYGQVKDDQ